MKNSKKAKVGVAGAVIATGVAVAGKVLSDEKTRKKIMDTISDVADQVRDASKSTKKEVKKSSKAKKAVKTVKSVKQKVGKPSVKKVSAKKPASTSKAKK